MPHAARSVPPTRGGPPSRAQLRLLGPEFFRVRAGRYRPAPYLVSAGGGRHDDLEVRAQPVDLVVWPGHLGIYAGGDTVIDAGRTPGAVTERTIWGNPTFVTFR